MRKTIISLIFFSILLFSNCKKDTCSSNESSDPDTSDIIVYKPNIYIYPIETIELEVKLDFPQGGSVIESIPKYNEGWNITVDTSGLINNEYRYLFYECKVPNLFQYDRGWIIKGENLTHFFQNNLAESGFSNEEILDFIEYWIPLLDSSTAYRIYPQYKDVISSIIGLIFSKEPDNLLRLFYVIKENSSLNVHLHEPEIPEFQREGYFVVEWGVILK